LEFNTQQAKNNAETSGKLLSDFVVSSAISGDIFLLNAKVGDWISPVKSIAVIGNANHYILRLNIDEIDISQIHENQTAIVSLDAYPGKSFKAHVSRIIPIMDQKNQSFTVEAVFDELPGKLYPGLSAEVNIITHVKPKALLIPLSYLGKNNKVNTDKGEVEVKTGLKNMQWVEILDGISANATLFEPAIKK
ncbi:MAG: efflux RND transporter periplasmic adaptor subunit, partial [Bacteroidota bacterium]